jgi:4-amino-4-deoxy-L-arabinose transferase-like glycosyltransferase
MFFVGKELFDRGVGFWAALLFQCLPVSGRILSDALSEALFLLLMSTALYLALRALRSRSSVPFVWCGLLGGLAYLTRPEGAVFVVAVVLLLLVMQVVPSWRRPWRWTLASGGNLILVATLVGSHYVVATGHFTNKPSGGLLPAFKRKSATVERQRNPEPGLWQDRHRGPAVAVQPLPLAVWLENQALKKWQRLGQGLWAIAGELAKGFHYYAWLPALLGMWWSRQRLLREPGTWLVLLLCLVHLLVLWRLTYMATYVSERHVLLLVLCGLFPAVAGIRELALRVSTWWQRRAMADEDGAPARSWSRLLASAPALSVLLLLGMAGSGLPKTLQCLHSNRAGHHAAGLWLAKHAKSTDVVYDGHFGWASYYAGRLFLDAAPDPKVWVPGRMLYIVKGTSREHENPFGPTNAKADFTEEEIKAGGGKVAWHWPLQAPEGQARVVIWAVRLPW